MGRILILAGVISALVTGVMLQALVDNNNQGEAYDTVTGAVDWSYLLEVGLVLWGVGFVLAAAPLLMISYLRRPESLDQSE